MMVKCWLSKSGFQTEANLGVKNDQGQFYHVDPLMLLGMENLTKGVTKLRTHHLNIHWDYRVYLI